MIDAIVETFRAQEELLWLLGLGSIVLFVLSALLIPWIIIVLPTDFFTRMKVRAFSGRHPVIAFFLIILRNMLGSVLLIAGIIMLFIPGQGLLTILIALALIDFPGKHNLLLRMMSNPRVFNAANGIRRWAKKPEFLPAESGYGHETSGPLEQRAEDSMRKD